jgi:thymidine phosphorylase
MAVVALGGGRTSPGETIDHRVGFDRLLPLGARVDRRTPIARLHARDAASADEAERRLVAAYRLGETAPPDEPLIAARLSAPTTARN